MVEPAAGAQGRALQRFFGFYFLGPVVGQVVRQTVAVHAESAQRGAIDVGPPSWCFYCIFAKLFSSKGRLSQVFSVLLDFTNQIPSSTLAARASLSRASVSVSRRGCGALGLLSLFGGDNAFDSCLSSQCHSLLNSVGWRTRG